MIEFVCHLLFEDVIDGEARHCLHLVKQAREVIQQVVPDQISTCSIDFLSRIIYVLLRARVHTHMQDVSGGYMWLTIKA